jgi:uncharacterized membrane protein
VVGRSDFALRSLSLMLGVAAIPLLGMLGRRIVGNLEGLVAAGLLAVSPLAIELSNEARAYALLQVLTLTTTLLLFRGLRTRRPLDWVVYCGSVVTLCWTHYYGFVVPLAHGVVLVAAANLRKHIVRWFMAVTVAGALWCLWLPGFLQQLQQPGNTARFASTWHTQFWATPVAFAFGRTLVWRDSSHSMLLLASVAVALLFGVPAIRQLWLARRENTARILLLWIALPVVLPLLAALMGKPLYHVRAASVALPAFLLSVAGGWVRCSRPSRVLLLTSILAITGASLYGYATHPLKDDWRAAVPVILSGIDSNSVVIVDPVHEPMSLLHYAVLQGQIPTQIVGVMNGPSNDGKLLGVCFDQGRSRDSNPRDCTGELLASSNVCLVMCVPVGRIDQYSALLAANGYSLMDSVHFHRIDVYFFGKSHTGRFPQTPP